MAEPFGKEPALCDQADNIRRHLSRLGNTPFEASAVKVRMSESWFVPSSLLSEMRRKAVERLIIVRRISHRPEKTCPEKSPVRLPFPDGELTYLGNVSNRKAEAFYRAHEVEGIAPAFEIVPQENVPLMFARHCLRYSLGWCPALQKQVSPYKEPFYLSYKDTRLRLQFDCQSCQMLIFAQ
jgi:putative protease